VSKVEVEIVLYIAVFDGRPVSLVRALFTITAKENGANRLKAERDLTQTD
jgi:hypothetical protein